VADEQRLSAPASLIPVSQAAVRQKYKVGMPESCAEADPVVLAYKQVAIPITKPGNLLDEVTDYRLQFSFDGEQQPTQEPVRSHSCVIHLWHAAEAL
jgi:hypothetical protein